MTEVWVINEKHELSAMVRVGPDMTIGDDELMALSRRLCTCRVAHCPISDLMFTTSDSRPYRAVFNPIPGGLKLEQSQ